MSKQRRNSLGYFFDQIVEIILPVHMRYLLWAAMKGEIIIFFKTFFCGKKHCKTDAPFS